MSDEIWYKYNSPSGEFYSPFAKSKATLKYYDSPFEMYENLSNISSGHFEVLTPELAMIFDKAVPQNDPIKLPKGVYYHEYGGSSVPERLIPMTLKDDGYLEIIDSLSELNENIDHFVNNKKLYDESKSTYKLGVLLYGPPGTGKTSYVRQFASKMDAIVIYMDGVPTRNFLQKLESSTNNDLKIIIFEEAVSLMDSSDDIREMLDFLDGSRSITNAIYFLSTNYPESIPENIVRNGRIDVFVNVTFPKKEAREKLISLYLGRTASEDELKLTENMPIVDIRELCFLHKKTTKSFSECAKIVEDKNKILKKHFGKAKEIRLT